MRNKKQIFFLHFAGGSCYSYDFLASKLTDFEVYQLELPGRGKRVTEPLLYDFDAAVEDYARQVLNKLGKEEFLIFGHSMGANMGAYLTSKLEALNIYPNVLMLSGNPGPGIDFNKNRYQMGKEEFLAELKRIGGMPGTFFAHEELIDYFLPILRADFQMVEQNTKKILSPLSTPVVAMMGSEEELVGQIENWKKFAATFFDYRIFKGNHFFIQNHVEHLVHIFYQMMNKDYFRQRRNLLEQPIAMAKPC